MRGVGLQQVTSDMPCSKDTLAWAEALVVSAGQLADDETTDS